MNTQNETQDKDIVVNAVNAGNFTTLANALKAADLVSTYKGIGPYTFFAPTDEAFKKLPKGELDALLQDKEKLTSLLNLHVMNGKVLGRDLQARDSTSVHGGSLKFGRKDGTVTVNGARVSRHEIDSVNGVIHPIDAVLQFAA